MTVDRYLSDATGTFSGPQAGPRPKTGPKKTPKTPTYGGTGMKPVAGSRHRRPASSPMVARTSPQKLHAQQQQQQEEMSKLNKMQPHLSLSAKRRSDLEISVSRSQASELRFREANAMLTKPGWISGSQLASSTLLYQDARQSGHLASNSMSDIARLGRNAPLGWGSHAYRIGGDNEHSADKRLTALSALREQKAKKWWKESKT